MSKSNVNKNVLPVSMGIAYVPAYMSPGLVTSICGSENSVWQFFA